MSSSVVLVLDSANIVLVPIKLAKTKLVVSAAVHLQGLNHISKCDFLFWHYFYSFFLLFFNASTRCVVRLIRQLDGERRIVGEPEVWKRMCLINQQNYKTIEMLLLAIKNNCMAVNKRRGVRTTQMAASIVVTGSNIASNMLRPICLACQCLSTAAVCRPLELAVTVAVASPVGNYMQLTCCQS